MEATISQAINTAIFFVKSHWETLFSGIGITTLGLLWRFTSLFRKKEKQPIENNITINNILPETKATQTTKPPKFSAHSTSYGGTQGNIRVTFNIENIGGNAFNVIAREIDSDSTFDLKDMRRRASKTIELKLRNLPHSLSLFITCEDSEGNKFHPNIHGTFNGTKYELN